MQGKVEAATENAPATGRPPRSPYGLTVHRVGLQAVPRVHSIPYLQGKHREAESDTVVSAVLKVCKGLLGNGVPIIPHQNKSCSRFLSPHRNVQTSFFWG